MSRSVRRVPANWEHPRGKDGDYVQLKVGNYSEIVARWNENSQKWSEGFWRVTRGDWLPKEPHMKDFSYEEWAGSRPQASEYMPEWQEAERTHYQMYSDTVDVPISPVKETPEALAQWLVENNAHVWGDDTASYDEWLAIIIGGGADGLDIEYGPEGVKMASGGVELP